jgi:hypothetical protein
MRGLDPEERRVLDVIARGDVTDDYDQSAVERCATRGLYRMVFDLCRNCGDLHMMPALTSAGRLAMTCDEMSKRTLEL